jgi:hypothetical protein
MQAAKPKKLKVEMVAEVHFQNYAEAADHQIWLEAFVEELRKEYPMADLQIRESRDMVSSEPDREV